ncbi:unnamed protein product [Cladocopium goreaui]|uniref:UDP-glycosyltransferases domain-containing protein n=1 Tax=Cladocopium goreaui TaxID=2562237 RepID=A0A9P1FRC2_9DINO|nr:unnamed protein product [Cladocopium goreaui]
MASVAVVVVAADRGHFNWSLPLAEALVTDDVVQKVEYWTSEESQPWLGGGLPPQVTLGGSTGSFSQTKKLVDVFTELSSSGDTDEEGGRALEEHFAQEVQRRGVAPTLEEALSKTTPPQEVQDALLHRLKMRDVAIVVYEQTWCSWAEAVAQKAAVPSIAFQPSYIDVFRHSAGCPPRAFQQTFNFGSEGMVYTLASCLRRHAPVPAGRHAVGAILPRRRSLAAALRSEDQDQELLTWLNLDGPPVVYCSLGSHMLSRVLGPGSLTALVKGLLAVPCRVLFVLSKTAREFADADSWCVNGSQGPQDPEFAKLAVEEKVKLPEWVNQPAVLAHHSTSLFLSHCGANSLHEALACGRPILALPFFDDQYYNAAALVEAGCALRIAKRPVEAQQVTAAVKKLLSPDAKLAAEKLQQELVAEDGTLQAAKWVAHVIAHGNACADPLDP